MDIFGRGTQSPDEPFGMSNDEEFQDVTDIFREAAKGV